jgi:hypothetical protein
VAIPDRRDHRSRFRFWFFTADQAEMIDPILQSIDNRLKAIRAAH